MSETTLDAATLAPELRLAVTRFSRRLRSQRVDESVTITQLLALFTLRRHGAMSAGELAAYERVQPPSMTRVIASLEHLGLVTRTPHPRDGRQVVIDLTPKAHELLEAEVRAREVWLSARLERLGPREREILQEAAAIMEKLATE